MIDINATYTGENKKTDDSNDILEEYLSFSRFIQRLFISERGYIVTTENFQAVNLELMERAQERVKKHPLLWKLFFMIA